MEDCFLKPEGVNDVVLSCKAKKRSYLIFKPERELVLYRDGSFAYFDE